MASSDGSSCLFSPSNPASPRLRACRRSKMGSIVRFLLAKLAKESLPWMKQETRPVTINRTPKSDMGNLMFNVLVRLLDLNWIKSSAEPLRSGPVESAPSSVSTCSFHWLPDPHRSSSSLQARQMSHPLGRRRATSLTLHSKEVWKRIECKEEKCRESANASRQASPLTRTLSGFIMQLPPSKICA